MKSALTALLLSTALWGQVYSSGGPVVNNVGQPVAAQIAVCTTQPPLPNPPTTNPPNCSVYAVTYTDATLGTPCTLAPTTLGPISGVGCTNPGKTDSRGNYIVYAASSVYYAELYGYGIQTYIMPFSTASTAGNFSSPPPIGNVTPNTGAFTSLSATTETTQTSNATVFAANFSGGDCGAKINNALAALPSTGGVIDATGFQGTVSCSTAIVLSKPVQLKLGAVILQVPQIQITAAGVRVSGISQQVTSGFAGTAATTIQSNAALALIWSVSGNAWIVEDVNLDGNSKQGLVGIFDPYAGNGTIRNVKANNFHYNGFFIRGGLYKVHDTVGYNNGAEGMEIGTDSLIDGYNEYNGNGQCGLHIHGGGTRVTYVMSDFNLGCGVWIDGTVAPNWAATTGYAITNEIKPTSGNAGGYIFIETNATCTSGGLAPTWTQSAGANITDGSCNWVATLDVAAPGFINAITNANIQYNAGEGLLVQGASTVYSAGVQLGQITVNNAGNPSTSTSDCVRFNYVTLSTVGEIVCYGSALNMKNDAGGVIFASADHITIGAVDCYLTHKSCIIATDNASSKVLISNIMIFSNGDNTTAGNDLYAIELNNSATFSLTNVQIEDTRGTPYSKGIDAHLATFPQIVNYKPSGTSVVDSIGNAVILWQDSTGAPNVSGVKFVVSTNLDIENASVLQMGGTSVIDSSRNGTFAKVTIGGTNTAPVVATPTVGQAACIYAAGPPIQIGKCTTVVSSGGACTCAP